MIQRVFRKYWLPISGIAILVTTEIALRLFFGLGKPVLSQADSDTGYRFQPNQKVFRFGKRIEYNQYSQRSEEISPQKLQGTLRILMVGDSVLNGGNPTDQDQTITEKLEAKFKSLGQSTEVLNASAGSWGIGNHLGYLQKFGTFNTDVVIFQIGSHDLTQPTSTGKRIGHDPNYPNRLPLLATEEALTRYIIPRILRNYNLSLFSQEIPQVSTTKENQQFQKNMELFKTAVNLVRSQEIPVYVLFTLNRYDLIPNPKTPPYKKEFMQAVYSLQIPILDTYETWSKQPKNIINSYYRDDVHLNENGNEAVANLIFQQLCIEQKFKNCSGITVE
ncbi:MAG: SGNH/GDSL hydrolase family protein [Nostocaceae cyanobacterium]|nr:SGNH/GDSL hydrolase family protein [Nostocaceae cyanobacterium]